MADDINLPNLVSHLQVNLARTSGVVADATRQGSAVGAALGDRLRQRVVQATSNIPDIDIDANSSELDRDLHRVRQQLQQLGEQRIGVDISIEDALRQMNRLEPHLDRLARTHPRLDVQASVGQAARNLQDIQRAATRVDDEDPDITVTVTARTDDIDDVDNRLHRVRAGLGRLAREAGGLGARLAAPFAMGGAAVGALVPLLAGLLATLVNIAPAAALAVSGLAAVQLVSGTLKVAMIGVGEAVSAALDPSKAEEYAKALKKLSPEARSFVGEIHKLQPTLDKIRKAVQNKVFRGFDEQLKATAKTTLPTLKGALLDTGRQLNQMGVGVFIAARELGERGILGTALKGATIGLANLRRAPGQVVTALGQIGAAAAPSFARLTSAAGSALDRLSEKLTRAFASGAMQKAIEQAISLIGQLLRIVGNVASIFGAIFGAAQASGGGLLGVLENITAEIARVAKTEEVQSALHALFEVMRTIGATVGPLLAQALRTLAPIFTALGPPVQILIQALGEALAPVITALGPVLLAAAQAVGQLLVSLSPLLPVIGELIAALLPALTPLLDACTEIFAALAPIVQQVATIMSESLAPQLAALTPLIEPLADMLANQLVFWLGFLGDLLVELSPSLIKLGESFAEVLIACAPLIEAVANISAELLEKLAPYLPGLISVIAKLAAILASVLAANITNVLIPALQIVAAILRGDFSGAMDIAQRAAINMMNSVVRTFREMPGKARDALAPLAQAVQRRIIEAGVGMVVALQQKVNEAVSRISAMPGRLVGALGNVDNLLVGAGMRVVNGFISGIRRAIPSVESVLSGLTSKIPDWKGPKRRDATLLTPAGKSIIKGLVAGIDASTASLRSKLTSVTNLIERAISINSRNRGKVGGLGSLLARVEKDNARLLKVAKSRDAVTAKLSAAQKKLGDLVKERAKTAADIRGKILDGADIVGGNTVVNSIAAITVGLQQAVAKTKAFAANIAKLKKAGLRGDLLQQIADAGVDGGSATADALAKATPAELKRINDLQAQLAAAASKTGITVAGALYDAGIKAAQGLVDGLKKQQGAIEKQMEKIAAAMVGAIKKALKIKSPSRVFVGIGALSGDGLIEGMHRSRSAVAAASASMAAAAVGAADIAARAFATVPAPGGLTAAYAGSGGRGDTTNNFYLSNGDATPDGILRALSWRGLVGGTSG